MAQREDAYIVSICRSAIGVLHGGIGSLSATQLGALAIKEAVKRAGVDSAKLDEVIMGQVVQGGAGQAPARQAAIHGGIPATVPALTINKVCGSGLKAVMLAAQSIRAGDQHAVVAGGMESMSQTPYVIRGAKTGTKFGHQKLDDIMVSDGLWDSFNNFHMGSAAEYTARKAKITREMQDEFAFHSHRKANEAWAAGKFGAEIFPIEIPQRKGAPVIFQKDENPRPEISVEGLAKLRPAFEKEGTVTAGNAPGLNDGSAASVVVSESFLKANNLKPIARVVDYAVAGTEPIELFFSPIYAVQNLMKKMNVKIDHWDLIEANEAFSAQALADGKGLGWDWDRVNVHGGAVGLGHPIGASGTRILATLIYALKDRGKKNGLATLCLGGGNAVALAIEIV
ncbi:MAG: acetyl-CoA C-acetyltransferase [candidate division Zixibacteria bacterium]|jgi:acetyl-CoA C-acetyltransferase|nr:acetyl-CoA C-acetyltransferase [candidate division Zixibacteria bacterium]